MLKPRCPDPERLALLIENRLGRISRARILRHAADCVSCRRQLAIASLTPIGPFRAAFEEHLSSGRLTVCAGLALGVIVLWFLNSGPPEDPAPRTPRPSVARVRSTVQADVANVPRLSRTERPLDVPRREMPPYMAADDTAPLTAVDFSVPEREGVAPAPAMPNAPRIDLTHASIPHRLDSVAESSKSPLPEPRAVESETMGRLAILDPFGSLALEGTGGRLPVQGSRVVPMEARIAAVGRASGFRLGESLRVQLSAGSAVSVFQNMTRRCAGLAVLQGALLVESNLSQAIYLRREGCAGILEGMNGPVLVNTGTKSDSLTVTPLGAGGAVWKRNGLAPVEIPSGDTLGIETNSQELTGKGKPKPVLSRFISWPEPTSLFYSSFEDDVQGMERPIIVQGAVREGIVSAAAATKGKKTIELTLPASLQNLPSDATLRLRVRTTAARIQCGVGTNAARSVPITVTQRNRSETVWTTLSVAIGAFDPDGHRGGRQRLRGNLTFVAEAASRIAAEDLVFDIDEIEISRS